MRTRVTSVGLILAPRPSENFTYPAHIDRASIDALPAKPGVYFFRDRTGAAVYIGKSVNIRSRVLAHLRTPEEAAMLEASRRVDYRQTTGEIGALLLESKLIKQYQPFYNILLKDIAESFALHLPADSLRPQAVGCSEVDADEAADLYGLFVSRYAALEGLHALARRHGLCPALLGLEARIHGRACFAHQLGRCRGACIGRESADLHARRLRQALQELNDAAWPHGGPLGIVEADGRRRQIHVIDRWAYIGSLEGRRRQVTAAAGMSADMDIYKILAGPLAQGRLATVPCLRRDDGRGRGIRYALAES